MPKNVPNVPGDLGNTKSKSAKKVNPALKWIFTWNNYHALATRDCEILFQDKCKKYIFQKEVGANGTPHLQGAVWLKNKARGCEIGLPKAVHWEVMRDEEASIAYCQKKETSIGEVYKWGFPKELKIIQELRPWQLAIEKIAMQEPDGRSVYWFWENTGGFGKSSFCKYMYVKHNAIVIQGGKHSDIMNIIFNIDMNDVNTLIIDVPRCNRNAISYSSVECILNGMITNTKYETGRKVFNPPNVIVFSNYEPDLYNDNFSANRWQIHNLETYSNNIIKDMNNSIGLASLRAK